VTAVPLLSGYAPLPGAFDEILAADGPRPPFARVLDALARLTTDELARLQQLAEQALLNQGVTFSVYADNRGTEKIFPFCLIPRLVAAADFAHLERGLAQRLRALSAFLDDVYGAQAILAAGVIPAELVLGAAGYQPTLRGVTPPGGVRIHIAGVDLIRDPAGTWQVLEDNLRTPSGVSYVVENRTITKRVIPRLLDGARVHRVDHYPTKLAETLRAVSPRSGDDTTAVVLTPGPYNSAYFEHSFLARTMGLELVTAPDLFVDGDVVYCKTTRGPRRIDVIYRRTDETFLDPEVFRPDSVLGVRGLLRAYAAGNVALANAPGNGVADDKAVYPFVPDDDPLLPRRGAAPRAGADVRLRPGRRSPLRRRAPRSAGGQGRRRGRRLRHADGPEASAAERAEFRARIEATPRRYIAQHRVELSTCPTWIGDRRRLEPRRVDLRPYVLTSPSGPWVLPGGLTRVALVDGSYVVNSSQGGGSKDTWVLKSGGAI
jgi:uncharacterized circularly permuted ATP-grasp superfamily protein